MTTTRRKIRARRGTGFWLGLVFLAIGLFLVFALVVIVGSQHDRCETVPHWIMAVVFTLVGIPLVSRGIAKGRRYVYLREHGVPRAAQVVGADYTGVRTGDDMPIYRLSLQVAGPSGPYRTSVDKILLEHQVNLIIGTEVRVLANPDEPTDIILDE